VEVKKKLDEGGLKPADYSMKTKEKNVLNLRTSG
jgi:hypothetical protein